MENKTKIGVAVIFLLVLVFAVVLYLNMSEKDSAPTQATEVKSPASAVEKKENTEEPRVSTPSEADKKNYQELDPNMKTATVNGEVVDFSSTSIEISNGGVKNKLPISSDVLVILIKDGKSEKKTVADIRKGDTVAIVINASNSKVVAIQINAK